jgi:hypothetical protein
MGHSPSIAHIMWLILGRCPLVMATPHRPLNDIGGRRAKAFDNLHNEI